MIRLLPLFILVMVLGCTHLRPDASIPAIDAGYPTAEFFCGERFNGLGVCRYQPGSPSLAVKIQGYYSGSIRVDSERCGIASSQEYVNSQEVVLTITPKDSCLLDIVVSPEYPKPKDTFIKSFKGRLYIKVLAGDAQLMTKVTKLPEGTEESLWFPSDSPVRVAFQGCGTSFDRTVTPDHGMIVVSTHDLGANRRDCLYEGVALLQKPLRISWMVWEYSKQFTPLPTPVLTVDGDHVTIDSDPATGILSVDGIYKLKSSARFKFPDGPHVIRALTSAGRSVLGIWDGKEIRWLP